MANPLHFEWLLAGAEMWNGVRQQVEIEPGFVGVNFPEVFAEKMDDNGAIPLQGYDLRLANFGTAKLIGANLQDVNLENAYLWGADLTGSDLSNANLNGADLRGATLDGVNLAGASFASGARAIPFAPEGTPPIMQAADLRDVKGITNEDLNNCSGDRAAQLPNGWTHPAHWVDAPS